MSGDLAAIACAVWYIGFVFGWGLNVIVNEYRNRD